MFDVQVWRHRHSPQISEEALESIARYYRRVTTTASPMGRLVGRSGRVQLLADDLDVSRFASAVNGFEHRGEALRFDESQRGNFVCH